MEWVGLRRCLWVEIDRTALMSDATGIKELKVEENSVYSEGSILQLLS